MAYKILKPETVDTRSSIWGTIKTRWQFWSFFVLSVVFSGVLWFLFGPLESIFGPLALTPFSVVLAYIFAVVVELYEEKNRASVLLWKRFAEINGWKYEGSSNVGKELGVMFQQGHDRHISRYIGGAIDGREFRMFNYSFIIGSGKSQRGYGYTVFAFKFNGSFPHIYLNNRHNSYSIKTGERVPLSSEFEKQFVLSVPRKYEIEALEIFTPDLLSELLDKGITYDIEFVGQEMIVFVDGFTSNFEKFEKEFNIAIELNELFRKKLDKFKFHAIGNISHQLK